MAARCKLTPEVQERICQALSVGATYEHAAAFGGITYETLNQWRKTKPGFSEALKDAEARAVVGWLAKIERAASEGVWQAAAWKLERRYPQLYGRTLQQVEHSGPDGGPLLQQVNVYVDGAGERLRSRIVELASRRPEGRLAGVDDAPATGTG